MSSNNGTQPLAFFFSPEGSATQILKLLAWAQQNNRQARFWHNVESNMLIVAVECPFKGENTGNDVYAAMITLTCTYNGMGVPSQMEWYYGIVVPRDYKLEIRDGVVVAVQPPKPGATGKEGTYTVVVHPLGVN